MGIISVFLGAMAGGCVGVVLTCLIVAARRADEQLGYVVEEERYLPQTRALEDKPRRIQFTDASGMLLFSIPDWSGVVLTMGNGESTVNLCQYLDEEHARIDGVVWQLRDYVLEMEKRGIAISPPVMCG